MITYYILVFILPFLLNCDSTAADDLKVVPLNSTALCKSSDGDLREKDLILFHLEKPVDSFVGRKDELNELVMSQSGQKIAVVTGPKGIGKSELVKKYAQVFKEEDKKSNIIWIETESYDSLVLSFKQLASKLGIDISSKPPTSILQETFTHFKNKRTLFIFDDASSDNYILNNLSKFILTEMDKFYFVVTSRDDNWNKKIFKIIELNVFTKEESKEYIKKKLDTLIIEDSEVERLAEILKYLPVALNKATNFILQKNKEKPYSVNDFICQYEEFDAIKRQPTSIGSNGDQKVLEDELLEEHFINVDEATNEKSTHKPVYQRPTVYKYVPRRPQYKPSSEGSNISPTTYVSKKLSNAAYKVEQEIKNIYRQINDEISKIPSLFKPY